jgi:hypothetical protein
MPKVIEVPGVGNVEFPDEMKDAQIVSAIKNMQPQKSVGGFAANALTSTGDLLGGLYNAVRHAGQTLEGIGAIPVGIYEKMGGPTPDSWGKPGERQAERQLDGIVDHYKQRYGSVDAIGETAYRDPAGFAADAAGLFSAGAGGARAANLGRTAAALETAASVVDPLSNVIRTGRAVTTGGAKLAGKSGVAERLYQSSLKPNPGGSKTSLEDINRVVQTGLKERIPVTRGGLARLQGLIDDVNGQIAAAIDPAVDIDPRAVAGRLNDTRREFANQVNPHADLQAIDDVEKGFLTGPGAGPMPANQAQAVKVGTYTQLRKKFGELGSAATEAEKALARGLKEELATAFPELKNLNARDSRLLQLEKYMEQGLKRISNRENLPIGSVNLAMIKSLIDSPTFKSYAAIALDAASGGKSIAKVGAAPRMAGITSRVNDWVSSMFQPEPSAQPLAVPAQ